jgi:hypothetical protein
MIPILFCIGVLFKDTIISLFYFWFNRNKGTYFDVTNNMKIREEYTRGKRTNFVKTPCSPEELN